MFKNKKKRAVGLFLGILIFVFLGLFGLRYAVLAEEWCDSKDHTKAVCPDANPIKMQIELPLVSTECTYTAKEYNFDTHEVETKEKTMHCVKGFPEYLKGVYNLFVSIVGILAVIMIMLGGFQWLLAAGNAQKITGAKTTIISAIMGLVLTLGTYSILNWVNPSLVSLKFKPQSVYLGSKGTLGWCNNTDKKPLIYPGESEECGKTYILADGDDFCTGVKVSGSDLCYTIDGGKSAQKIDFLTIKDPVDGRYEERMWKGDNGFTCGHLVVRITTRPGGQGTTTYLEDFLLGTKCSDGESCIIDQQSLKGAKFYPDTTVEWKKSGTPKNVGYVNGYDCL